MARRDVTAWALAALSTLLSVAVTLANDGPPPFRSDLFVTQAASKLAS